MKEFEPAGTCLAHATNLRLRACCQTVIDMCAVNTSEEGLHMMIKSMWVMKVLRQVIKDRIAEPDKDYNVLVREFKRFPVDLETRAFVFNGQLTALTQYHTTIYVPQFAELEQQIVAATRRLVAQVVPALDSNVLEHFSLDLVNVPDGKGGVEIFVVELNPFAETLGTSCFAWNLDKPVLMGLEDFEFRFNREAVVIDKEKLALEYLKLVEEVEETWSAPHGNITLGNCLGSTMKLVEN